MFSRRPGPSRGRGQGGLTADVEQDVGLARGDCGRVRGAHGLVVEVEPLVVVDRERCVVPGSRPVVEIFVEFLVCKVWEIKVDAETEKYRK